MKKKIEDMSWDELKNSGLMTAAEEYYLNPDYVDPSREQKAQDLQDFMQEVKDNPDKWLTSTPSSPR